jgi:MFS-type transporter involved in bile tolerance (Atg22 family)
MDADLRGRVVYYGSGYILTLAGLAGTLWMGWLAYRVGPESTQVVGLLLALVLIFAGATVLRGGAKADAAAAEVDGRQ